MKVTKEKKHLGIKAQRKKKTHLFFLKLTRNYFEFKQKQIWVLNQRSLTALFKKKKRKETA